MFSLRLFVSGRILPNITSQSCCSRFIKKGDGHSRCVTFEAVDSKFFQRTYVSSVDPAKETQLHDSDVQDEDHGKRRKKSRPSAAKTSLRRAALEAHISQHASPSSIFRAQENTRESKVK